MLICSCVTSELDSSEEEWKSLRNPENRNLFIKILQSYLNGRGMNLVNLGKKGKLTGNLGSKTKSNFDIYQQDLESNNAFDV
ncbi:uncharacterized protein C2orf66 homolog [Polypterus senegalus]|uniref:uncharacterized protein C2orf66 homolog n=1 Tax=Polypterus senegalus TaxID=55291 RepID=UPI001964FD39|nr:uncharacterized protein C2orf66 homolog [Polypterus senegalus]